MIKRIISLIILLISISHCGFSPLYSKKTNINFSISSIKFEGDRSINNFLKTNLKQFQNNNYNKKFDIVVVTEYGKVVLSKDKAANTTSYQLSLNTTFKINSNNKTIKELIISEKKIMDNINDDFQEQKNERTYKQNFASSISNKLLTELSMLDDN
jgi:hypothetical protein